MNTSTMPGGMATGTAEATDRNLQDTITALDTPVTQPQPAEPKPTAIRVWVDTSNTVSFTTDITNKDDPAQDLRDIGEAARDGEFIADPYFIVRARDIKCATLLFED